MKAAESVPAVLPCYQLAFNMPGIPFTEPAFAGVTRIDPGGDGDGEVCTELIGMQGHKLLLDEH